jgi:hypothetical protein
VDCAFDFGNRSLIAPPRVYGNGYHSLRLSPCKKLSFIQLNGGAEEFIPRPFR